MHECVIPNQMDLSFQDIIKIDFQKKKKIFAQKKKLFRYNAV